MASRKRGVPQANCSRRKCNSKHSGPVVKRIAKGRLHRKERERRRSLSLSRGGKVIPAAFFDDLAKKAIEQAPEYLRQRVG